MQFKRGFYKKYKHDPNIDVYNEVFEVLNIVHHTETGELMVVYRPLYETFVYKQGMHYDARPLSMFIEKITVEGVEKPRFAYISDPHEAEIYEWKSEEMYSNMPEVLIEIPD